MNHGVAAGVLGDGPSRSQCDGPGGRNQDSYRGRFLSEGGRDLAFCLDMFQLSFQSWTEEKPLPSRTQLLPVFFRAPSATPTAAVAK